MDDTPNYMQAAAEKAINDLQRQVDAATAAAAEAKNSSESAAKSANLWKRLTIGLCVGFALLLAVCALGVHLYMVQDNATNSLRQQAVNSCQIGNDRATGTVTALDELVTLLEGPSPTAKTRQEAAAYDKYVAQHNQKRDCTKAYQASAG